MKKKIILLVACMLVFSPQFMRAEKTQDAKEEPKVEETVKVEDTKEMKEEMMNGQHKFRKTMATVKEVNKEENKILVESENGEIFYNIGMEIAFDLKTGEIVKNHEYKVGEKLVVFQDELTPVALSMPGMTRLNYVFVNGGEKAYAVDVDFFDEKGIGLGDRLQINSLNGTKIYKFDKNEAMLQEEAENVLGNHLVVFYKEATKSIPPQTTPEIVYVLDQIQNDLTGMLDAVVEEETEAMPEDKKEETTEKTEMNEAKKVKANKSMQKLTLNGTEVKVGAYMVEDTNYFRLRDLAAILKDTEVKFSVGYNEETKQISIIKEADYEVMPEDLKEIPEGEKDGSLRVIKIMVGEEEKEVKAVLVEGNNYVGLRSFAELIGLDVNFDNETKTILLTTSENMEEKEEMTEMKEEMSEDKKEEMTEEKTEDKKEMKEEKKEENK